MPTGSQQGSLRKRLSSKDGDWPVSRADRRVPGVARPASLSSRGRPSRPRGLSRTEPQLRAGLRVYTTALPVSRSHACSTSPRGSQGGAPPVRAAHRPGGRRKGENCSRERGYVGTSTTVARHSRLSKQLMVRVTYLRSTR
jgi:hypothetical protein